MKRQSLTRAALLAVCFVAVSAVQAQAEPQSNNQMTIWVGNETLPGYGRLEFEFHANGKAVMIDAREVCNGSFILSGSSVTITFPGVAVYQGMINGNTMSGTARDDTRNWN